jgi:methionine sulfoxide reductase catalytic subunit
MIRIHSSEITPESVYFSRRKFLKAMGLLGAGAVTLAACGTQGGSSSGDTAVPGTPPVAGAATDELGSALTPFDAITHYNNYYEFTINKEGVASLAKDLPTSPWSVQVGGLVSNPKTYAMEDLLKRFTQEERIYRLRCVEAWSMVIPWTGFRLADLLKEVQPTSAAKYVRFEALYAPDKFPGQNDSYYAWPYVEGLRLDEAMNDLAILATGLYGQPLPPQDGAPIRLVTPWKYGFKGIKAIVKIDLVDYQPTSLWMNAAGNEYGFYANVNPEVNHPRWSQGTERRIGELGRRKTLPFNGYADEVAALYAGMDLRANY